MAAGESKPLLVVGYSNNWDESHELVIKLREPGVFEPHHGGTALACELICSMLARLLGFAVPDYAIVDISAEFADAVTDDNTGARLRQNIGPNFGSVYLQGCRSWLAQRMPFDKEFAKLFANLIEFDSTVINHDRTSENSNLLWDGKSCYPIDHGFALSVHRHSNEGYKKFLENPLLPDETIVNHMSVPLLRWNGGFSFDSIGTKWNEFPMTQVLNEVRRCLPPEWESKPGDFDRIFDFLGRRADDFVEISAQLRRQIA